MSEDFWATRAERLLGELMPVAVVVAGPDAGAAVAALRHAGAEAMAMASGAGVEGSDLALLLADPAAAGSGTMRELVQSLTAATDRILFVPASGGDLSEITAWFELFAERGFQPVTDYDAGFLGAGAFLVDRNAVAAETELAAFADRLRPEAEVAADAPPAADPAKAETIEALRRGLAARDSELAAARAELAEARAQLDAWAPLRRWVDARIRARARRGMPALLPRLRRRLADEDAIRAAELFDPAWYIASHPDLAADGGDPVQHYRCHAATTDPGPWFDTAAYLRDHPELDPRRAIPLLHALRTKR